MPHGESFRGTKLLLSFYTEARGLRSSYANAHNPGNRPENVEIPEAVQEGSPSAPMGPAQLLSPVGPVSVGECSRGRYLDQLADEHQGVHVGLRQDSLGNHLTVMEGLRGQPHLRQAARVDELKHLGPGDRVEGPEALPQPPTPPGRSGLTVPSPVPAWISTFISLFFVRFHFLSNLYVRHRAQTHNPEIKSYTLHRLSQPGDPQGTLNESQQMSFWETHSFPSTRLLGG